MTARFLFLFASATILIAPPLRVIALKSPWSAATRKAPIPFSGNEAVNTPPVPDPAPAPTRTRSGLAGTLDGFIDRIFDGADTNHDGSISTSEAYELVLKMYVRINRKAPIKPPSREKVMEMFRSADANKSGRLDKEQFRTLALRLARRATSRVVAHKVVTILGAPLLAMEAVQFLKGREWVRTLADRIFPESFFGTNVAGLVRKAETWRMAFTVGFVVTLGNTVVAVVNLVLDAMDKKKGIEEGE